MVCVNQLEPLFDQIKAGSYDKLEATVEVIFEAEHQADKVKEEIRSTIPKTFSLPVFRGDLLGYLKLLDDIADSVEDVAVLVTIKKLALPSFLHEELTAYLSKVCHICRNTQTLNESLQNVVKSGFSGSEIQKTLDIVSAVETAEFEADQIQYKLAKTLFAHEDEMKATDVMLWFKIFGKLGQLANAAENAADRVHRMLTYR